MIHLLAQTNTDGSFAEGLTLMIIGMLVVFVSLVLLLGLVTLISKLAVEKPATAPASGDASAEPATTMPTGPDPQLVAVLSAAAATALHRPVRIRRVRFLGQDRQATGSAWSSHGRQTIMQSRPRR